MLVIFAAILLYPKVFKRDTLENLRSAAKISIAVMPFQNLTIDPMLKDCQPIVQQILITALMRSDELVVRQREYITELIQNGDPKNQAPVKDAAAKIISRKLEANVFIDGSIIQEGNIIRINAQLNDAKTGVYFHSFYPEASSPAMIINIADTLARQILRYLQITILKNKVIHEFQSVATSNSPEAYQFFIAGNNAFFIFEFLQASRNYEMALETDPNFNIARIMLSLAYYLQYSYEEAMECCKELYEQKDQMSRFELNWTKWLHARLFEKPAQEIGYLNDLINMDDQQPLLYYFLADAYGRSKEYTMAILKLGKGLEIYKKWKIKPVSVAFYTFLGDLLNKTGQFKREKKLYTQALRDFPGYYEIILHQARLAYAERDTVEGRKIMEGEYKSTLYEYPTEAEKLVIIARSYEWRLKIPSESERYYRQALSLDPDNPEVVNGVASLLIDWTQNVTYGLELNEKALNASPENYKYLGTRGEGLFKLGKYEQALEALKKSLELIAENTDEEYINYLKHRIRDVDQAITDRKKN